MGTKPVKTVAVKVETIDSLTVKLQKVKDRNSVEARKIRAKIRALKKREAKKVVAPVAKTAKPVVKKPAKVSAAKEQIQDDEGEA